VNKREWLSAVCAAAGTGLLWALSGWTHGWLWLAAALAAAWAGVRFSREQDARLKRCFGWLGAAGALAAGLVVRLNAAGMTGWAALGLIALETALLYPAIAQGWIGLMRVLCKGKKPFAGRRAFWLAFGVLVACWLPVYLAVFPGVTGYDVEALITQHTRGIYVDGHPIAHTLLVGLFYRLGTDVLGRAEYGFGLFTALQMLSLAAAYAYALYWLSCRRCPRAVWIGVLALFALAPQHGLMASTVTKDILFSAVLLVLAVEVCRFLMEAERAKRKMVWLADLALVIAATLLRKNMILAWVFVLVLYVCVAAFRRVIGRRFAALLLAGMVIGLGSETALKAAVDAQPGTVRELLCIPCQQLSRVYHLYGLDEPVGYEVLENLPFAEDYSPERADFTKRQARVDTPDRLVRFLKLWLRESVHFPVEYLDAFLYTNMAYWDWTDTDYAYTYDNESNGPRGSMTLHHNPHSQMQTMSLLPGLRETYNRLFTDNEAQQILPIRLLIHPALYVWLFGFALAWAICCRQRAALLALSIAGAYLATLVLGPCALIRYCFYLMSIAPVMLALLTACGKEIDHV